MIFLYKRFQPNGSCQIPFSNAVVGVLHQQLGQTISDETVYYAIIRCPKYNSMETVVYSKHYADFITITCLNWKPLLQEDRFKDIIIESLSFLCRSNRVTVYAFVIMSNHIHLIWQIMGENERPAVQRDFLKFTGQQILKILRNEKSPLQHELLVNSKDRKFQVWERNSLSIPLWSDKVMWQKLDYIHYNPVKAQLCGNPEDYKYSSASFYFNGEKRWDF